MPRALSSAGNLLGPWAQPPAEKAHLTSRALAFAVHPIGARPVAGDAVRAFAYRYGAGWQVLYVGRRVEHKISTAIGYGATHLLVLEDGTADEAWLVDELKPPLNGR
jgi:hypothetical protein